MTTRHLGRDQRKLLVDLQSTVEKRAKTAKGKPVRHQLSRTPTATQQAPWEAVHQARKQGMARDTVGKYIKAESPPTKLLSAKERAKSAPWLSVPDYFDDTSQVYCMNSWRH